ncbi:hypothetical protein Tco_1275247 [Tanacetum coccineum]
MLLWEVLVNSKLSTLWVLAQMVVFLNADGMPGVSGCVPIVNDDNCSSSNMSKKQRVVDSSSFGVSVPDIGGHSGGHESGGHGLSSINQLAHSGRSSLHTRKRTFTSTSTGNPSDTAGGTVSKRQRARTRRHQDNVASLSGHAVPAGGSSCWETCILLIA